MKIQKKYLHVSLPFILMAASSSQPVEPPQMPNTAISTNIDKPRQKRSIEPACNINQYFDKEEGRCLGLPGGGKVIHVDNTRTCPESNTLSVHCINPRYYYVCKEDKIILVECATGTHFDNRLQRCVYVDPISFDSSIIRPEDIPYQGYINVPECTRPGRFPLTDNCALFYVCGTNGHRLHQNVFNCPNGTGFDEKKKACAIIPNCKNEKDSSRSLCLVNAKSEHIQLEPVAKLDAEESFHAVSHANYETRDEYKDITTASLYVDPTVQMTTPAEANFGILTTASTLIYHNIEVIPTESTAQDSTSLNKPEFHYVNSEYNGKNEETTKRYLLESSSTNSYERLLRSTVMDKSSPAVNLVTESSNNVSVSTERDVPGTTTPEIREMTDRMNTTTAMAELSLTTEPNPSSKPTILTEELNTTTNNSIDALISSPVIELHEDRTNSSLTSTTERSDMALTTHGLSDEQSPTHLSAISTTVEPEFKTKLIEEELHLTTSLEFNTSTTTSPIPE